MSEILVNVENVSKKYCRDLRTGLWYGMKDLAGELFGANPAAHQLRDKEFWAIKDVSFQLKRGECLGLIGHNGAGKSTLLKMLNGLIKPDGGRIEMNGRVGALIELGAGFNPVLTGMENIYVNGSVLGFTKKQIDQKLNAIIEFAEIGEFINTPVQYYSSGMKVRLGFAVAAQMEPDVLIIDEVLAVGDVSFRVKCYNKIFDLLRTSAVIFVSHSMPQVSRICSHIQVMAKGQVQYQGMDVSIGINAYYGSLNSSSSMTVQDSGLGEILDVHYEDSQGKSISALEYLSSLRIKIKYLLKEVFEEIAFLIVFKNEEQLPVAQISSEIDMKFIGGERAGVVKECEILLDKIILNPGKYVITVSMVRGKRSDLLYVIRDTCELTVVGPRIGYAPVLLQANWITSDVRD